LGLNNLPKIRQAKSFENNSFVIFIDIVMGNFTRKSIIEQVATAIEVDLDNGMWDEKFPSIRKLVAHYDVSLITAFKAVSLLAEKGVLVSAGPNRPFKVNPLIKERIKTLSAKTSAETKPVLPLSAIRELANTIESDIAKGLWGKGDGSLRSLADHYKVSLVFAYKSLALLPDNLRTHGGGVLSIRVKSLSSKAAIPTLALNKIAVIIASQESAALPKPEILLKPEDFILTDLREADLNEFDTITSHLVIHEVPRCLVLVGAKPEHQQLMAKFGLPVISLEQVLA